MQPADVAIIGLACRFPTIDGPGDLWRVVRDGLEVTRARAEGSGTGRREGLLDDAAEFDADFFNLSPREARAMDPRQRLALELTWELLEDAFVVPETLRGERVSVCLGAMNDDYALLTLSDAIPKLDHHSFAGISRAMIANRISYTFGLQGSSITIDSGQSSSLVTVHMACESLRSGECALAIAGGIHINIASEITLAEREFGALSTAGHTYAFDARADGYVRSEGGGLVLLKPLPAALEAGDRIHAIIRGSAVGNAGHGTAAQTVPSVSGQADVIRRALASADLDSTQVDYVEAHGTGTKIGDPVEAKALGEVFAGPRRNPLSIGSVKTNIGHTGGAAGIAGLLKAILAIENAMIPPSLNYAGPASGIDPQALGLNVSTALAPWPPGEGPRRAGVSSFGMGGTNAHVIIEQSPAESPSAEPDDHAPVVPWVLTGRSEQALVNQAARLSAHVAGEPGLRPVDLAWSLATTRSVFDHRAVLVGADPRALTAGLAAIATGRAAAAGVVGRAGAPGKTVFVYPGQGAQWLGMGADLYRGFSEFARVFDEVAGTLDKHLRLPLRAVLWGADATLLGNTEFAQPALFAIEIALTALLRHWGVSPDVVMGHSVGEVTAAYVAGVITLPDAARIVVGRGRLMAGLPSGGVMIAVAASEDEAAPTLPEDVGIAAVNAPNAVVISGAESSATAVADRFAWRGKRVHRLDVSHAFHSVLMEPILDEFAELIADVQPGQPRIQLVSNISGELARPGYGSPSYWVAHVRRPVRFCDGVRAAESLGSGIFVEVGPGGGLSAAVEESLVTRRPVSVLTMAKDRPEAESVLTAAARLFTAGVAVTWNSVLSESQARRVHLPTYGFVRQRFWIGDATDSLHQAPSRSGDWAERLNNLAPKERHRLLLEMVCAHAAIVLGHGGSHEVDGERAFQDLGFDSLAGVELRNRLKTVTGLSLSRTLVFDHPTPMALADHLQEQLIVDDGPVSCEPDDLGQEAIWELIRKIPLHELRGSGLLDRLLQLAGESENSLTESAARDDIIDTLSPEALIAMALDSQSESD